MTPRSCRVCSAPIVHRDGETESNYRRRKSCGASRCATILRHTRAGTRLGYDNEEWWCLLPGAPPFPPAAFCNDVRSTPLWGARLICRPEIFTTGAGSMATCEEW